MHRHHTLRASLVFLMFSSAAQAASSTARDGYRDLRWMGRGGAGLASVEDGTAAFFNPAGLGRNETFRFNFGDIGLGGNQNIATSYLTFATLTSGDGTLSEKFSPLLGVPLGVEGMFFPHVAIPGFMVGFWDYGDGQIEYRDPVFPRLDIYLRNDYGIILGGGVEVLPRLYFGATLKYQRRTYLDEEITSATLLNASTQYLLSILRRGYGFGVNLGAQFVPKMNSKSWSAIGVALEDLGGTRFKNTTRTPTPAIQLQRLNAGFGYGFNTPVADLSVHFDVKDVLRTEGSYTKRVHMGVEVDLNYISLRGGFNQGYWSAGASFEMLPLVNLDLVTYGEEQGAVAGQRVARYYLIGVTLGMDLKASGQRKTGRRQKLSLDKIK